MLIWRSLTTAVRPKNGASALVRMVAALFLSRSLHHRSITVIPNTPIVKVANRRRLRPAQFQMDRSWTSPTRTRSSLFWTTPLNGHPDGTTSSNQCPTPTFNGSVSLTRWLSYCSSPAWWRWSCCAHCTRTLPVTTRWNAVRTPRRSLAGNWCMAMCSDRRARECFCPCSWVRESRCSVWRWSLWPLPALAFCRRRIAVLWWPVPWCCTFCWEHRPAMCRLGSTRVSVVSSGRAMCCWRRCWVLGKAPNHIAILFLYLQ